MSLVVKTALDLHRPVPPVPRRMSAPDGPGADDRRAGFTLIEILVVVAIIGLLLVTVAPAALQQFGKAKTRIAQQSITRLAGVLDLYRLDVGTYPSTQQGLDALLKRPAGVNAWAGPYIQDAQGLVDPWGAAYQYRLPSQRQGKPYDLFSQGGNTAARDPKDVIAN